MNENDERKEDENKEDEKKELEIVSDDGSSLDISPVYDHINAVKPKSAKEKPTNIVIPEEKKEKKENTENKRD